MEDISIPIPSKDIQMQLGAIRKSIDKLEKIKINYETLIRELSPITNAGLRKNII